LETNLVVSRPQGGLINVPVKKQTKKRARAKDSDEEDFEDSDGDIGEDKDEDGEDMTVSHRQCPAKYFLSLYITAGRAP